MGKYFILFSLFLFPGFLYAGNREIDSLKNELYSTVNSEKVKLCDIYQSLAVCYETINLDSTYFYLNKGLSLYKIPDYTDRAYLHLKNTEANYYYSIGDFEKSRNEYIKIFLSSLKMNDRDYDFDANIAVSLGVVYRKLGRQDSSIYYYNKAADYGKHSGNYETLSSIYYNIGAMYFGNSRFDEAIGNANYAVEYADKSGLLVIQIYARILLASSYARINKYAESVEILKQNIENALKNDSPLLVMSSISPLISSYQLWNKKDSVAPYLKKGDEFLLKIPKGHPTALEYIAVKSSVYNWMGRFMDSNEILISNPHVTSQVGSLKYNILLAKNYAGLGDYRKAYSKLQRAYELNDSISNNKISRDMSELNARYNVNAKELEISRLEKDKAEQDAYYLRISLYFGIVVLVLVAIVLFLQYKRRIQRKEMELVSVRKYIEGLENERKRLAKELHDGVCNDLYGAILQINRSDVTQDSNDKAVKIIDDIRNNARTISHELMPPSFKFADLNEMLSDYLRKITDQSGVCIDFSSYADVDWVCIPHEVSYEVYRICQELVNNIIKHCSVDNISIVMGVENNVMAIKFSYKGVWNRSDNDRNGIGLLTIEDRLKVIGGTLNITGNDRISIEVVINLSENK